MKCIPKRLRKALCLLLLAAIIITNLTGCRHQPVSEIRARIYHYVLENQDRLAEVANMRIPWDWEEYVAFLNEQFGDDRFVIDVIRRNEFAVDFIVCYAEGSRFGFYYSKTDIPSTLDNPGTRLTELSPGVYEVELPSYSVEYRTERICENFFYYKLTCA